MGAYSRLAPSVSDGAGGHHQVVRCVTSRLDAPAGARPDKGIRPDGRHSSSRAMAAEGPPMPVEQTLTFSPSRVPV